MSTGSAPLAAAEPAADTVGSTAPTSARRWRRALFSPLGVIAVLGCLVLVVIAVVAPWIWGVRASTSDPMIISQPPIPGHPFGTDAGGRDVLLRVLVGTRLSVLMALAATALGVIGGVLLGLVPLLLGGRAGRWVIGAINIAVAFPGLLLAISLSVIFGQSGLAATLAIGLAIMPSYARLTHNLASSVWGRDFVSAARVLGIARAINLLRHVLPNIRDPLIVNASLTAGGTLVAFAGLSFLGLGVQVPDFDWGQLLNEGVTRIFVTPLPALAPGLAIVLSGLLFTLLGEVLAQAITPSSNAGVSRALRRVRLTAAKPVAAAPEDATLSVSNLTIQAPGDDDWRDLVTDVSFAVQPGEIVGLVGESGSGKSLTLMALAGLVDHPLRAVASAARFEKLDLPIRAGGFPSRVRKAVGARLAMVFQDPMSSLNPSLSVGSQIAEVARIHRGMSRAKAKAAAIDALTAVRIPEPERRFRQYPHELSGGMRQRVMIAMGLVGEPSVLFADEPTTALDVTVQAEVLDLLRDINIRRGTAIVMVSHDIAVVTEICSRVLVMYRGRMVEQIDTADLLAGRAQHPYTRALVAIVPTMTTQRGRPLASIPEGSDFDPLPVAPLAATAPTVDGDLR